MIARPCQYIALNRCTLAILTKTYLRFCLLVVPTADVLAEQNGHTCSTVRVKNGVEGH